jgi:hypothetical protein
MASAAIPLELAAALKVLDTRLPEASRRAAAALEIILDRWRLTREGPFVSKLTGDGFPIELVFSSLETAIRYTCEVAGPAMAPRKRLECACGLLEGFQQPSRFPLAKLQDGCTNLSWGAWLGGRHTATSDRYKVYAEIPEQLTPSARSELSEALGRYHAVLESHAYACRIAGFDPVSGKIELYFRGRALAPQELRGLLHFSGLADREERLLCLLEEATQRPARVRLPGTQHGFSISLEPAGEVETFSFFVFARSLFGADPNTRSALLTLSKRQGWNLDHYAAVSAFLQRQQGRGPRHGIVAFIVERRNLPGISVGLRPGIQS